MPPKAESVTALDRSTTISVPVMKKNILNHDVLSEALFIAKTGRRKVTGDDGKEVTEQVSAKDHIDVIKMLINKVLPNAKETESDGADASRWLDVIAKDQKTAAEIERDEERERTKERAKREAREHQERLDLDAAADAINDEPPDDGPDFDTYNPHWASMATQEWKKDDGGQNPGKYNP